MGRGIPGIDPSDPRLEATREAARLREMNKMKEYSERYKLAFIRKVEEVAAANPDIRPEVFGAIVDEYMKQGPQRDADMLRAYKENPTPALIKQDLERTRAEYGQKLQDKIYKEYGDEGMKAMQQISREMQPKSIFSGIVKHFFNSEKGGIQWGAAGGAAVGGIIGYLIGGKAGGFMSILAPLIGAGITSYFAGRFIDKDKQATPTPRPDFLSKHRGKEKEPVKEEYVDKTIGKPAVDPVVKVEMDNDPERNKDGYNGVIISVTDKANPGYKRTYAGVYDPATKDLRIDGTRFNGPDNWVELSTAVTIPNVDMKMEGGVLKSFTLTQNQLEPARKQAEARAGKKDIMAEAVTPPTPPIPDYAALLQNQPPVIRSDADVREMNIRGTVKPTGPALQ